MNKFLVAIIGIFIVIGASWLVVFSRERPSQSTLQEQSEKVKAPDFALRDYTGRVVKLADFRSKPVIVNSWAAWCPFCQKELVDFAAAKGEFGDDIVIIAINRAESQETTKKYTDELGVTNDLVFLLDPSDSFYQSIGGFSMPETIFIDKDGNLAEHKRGPMELDEIRQKIQKLLSS